MGYEQLTAAWFRPVGLVPMASQDQAGRARVTALEADAQSRCFVIADGEASVGAAQAALLEQFQAEADLAE
eukprot:7182867-Alexandrium_andersonii.AAC.1